MADNRITFYEVLGVPRDAKATDIGRAYNRIKSDALKESAAPNPRGLAMAKVAFDTLMDPARRAEYDASLRTFSPGAVKKKKSAALLVLIAGVSVLAVGIGAYVLFTRSSEKPAAGTAALTPQQLLETASPLVGRVQSSLMSGEVRDAGVAVATAQDEMMTTCHGLATGSLITVTFGSAVSKAELARANEDLDVCTLKVKDVGPAFIKMRGGEPAVGEKIYTVVADGTRANHLEEGKVTRAIADAKGAALVLSVAGPLPTGSPVIDVQGRLVGIVTTPHAFGEGLTVALGTTRIAQARGGAAKPGTDIVAAAPTPSPSVALPAPSRRGYVGTKVDEGFTVDWEEDDQGHMTRPLQTLTKGVMGEDVIYWTRWVGRDVSRPQDMRCVVTFHEESDAVVDATDTYDNTTRHGYWYCGILTGTFRGRLFEGTYRFIIYVDGEKIAENSIRIEKRFLDRLHLSPLKLGLGLLACVIIAIAWLRKRLAREDQPPP